LSIRSTERLAEAGAVTSVSSVGDSFTGALAERIIGLYKPELIRRTWPWKGLGPGRVRHLGVGRLLQPPPALGANRACPAGRVPGYPPTKGTILDLVQAGRPIADVAQALGISDQSISSWRRQDRIDKGLLPGLRSHEHDERGAVRRTAHAVQPGRPSRPAPTPAG
jgi:Transposase